MKTDAGPAGFRVETYRGWAGSEMEAYPDAAGDQGLGGKRAGGKRFPASPSDLLHSADMLNTGAKG